MVSLAMWIVPVGAVEVGAVADVGRVAVAGEAAARPAREAGQGEDIVVDDLGHARCA